MASGIGMTILHPQAGILSEHTCLNRDNFPPIFCKGVVFWARNKKQTFEQRFDNENR
jgi:hypothetical protein